MPIRAAPVWPGPAGLFRTGHLLPPLEATLESARCTATAGVPSVPQGCRATAQLFPHRRGQEPPSLPVSLQVLASEQPGFCASSSSAENFYPPTKIPEKGLAPIRGESVSQRINPTTCAKSRQSQGRNQGNGWDTPPTCHPSPSVTLDTGHRHLAGVGVFAEGRLRGSLLPSSAGAWATPNSQITESLKPATIRAGKARPSREGWACTRSWLCHSPGEDRGTQSLVRTGNLKCLPPFPFTCGPGSICTPAQPGSAHSQEHPS